MMLRDVSSRHDPRYIRYWKARHAAARAGRIAAFAALELLVILGALAFGVIIMAINAIV